MYRHFFKRILDIIISLCGLVCLLPIFLIIAVAISIRLGSPVIFSQVRPGKGGRLFRLYKFRTMTDRCDANGDLLPDSDRMTPFGRKLRESSLDELPELYNILKGDMSLIGPRPFLVSDMIFYTEKEMYRKTVLPGLTGLAQISGRNNISWEKKFEYDFKYIDNISFCEDMRILYRTFFKVVEQSDIATDGMDTAERYGVWLQKKGLLNEKEYIDGIHKARSIVDDFNCGRYKNN